VSLTSKTFRGASWIGAASILKMLLKVFSVSILARVLSPEEYGIVTATMVVVELAMMFADAGFGAAIIQKQDIRKKHIATGFFVTLLLSVAFSVLFYVSAQLLADILKVPELSEISRYLFCYLIFRVTYIYISSILAKEYLAKQIALSETISWFFGNYLVIIPLAFAGFSYWSIVIGTIVEAAVLLMLGAFYARNMLEWPKFDQKAFHELYPLALRFAAGRPVNFLSTNVDRFCISNTLGVQDLGLYSRAAFLTKTVSSLFGSMLKSTAFPSLSSIQADRQRLTSAVYRGLEFTAYLTIPIGTLSYLFSQEIILILLGEDWLSAITPFAILALGFYPRLGQRTLSVVFTAIGKPFLLVPINLMTVAFVVAGVYFLREDGLICITASIVASIWLSYFISIIIVMSILNMDLILILKLHIRPILISIFIVIVSIMLRIFMINLEGYWILFVLGVSVLAVIIPLAYVFPSLVFGPRMLELLAKLNLDKYFRRFGFNNAHD